MAKGYGFEFSLKEITGLLVVIVIAILAIPYIIKLFVKSTADEAKDLFKEPIQQFENATKFTSDYALTPAISKFNETFFPEGVKVEWGDTTYGQFANEPNPVLLATAEEQAAVILYAGRGITGADGLQYTDIVMDGRVTRFTLLSDGMTISKMSLPPQTAINPGTMTILQSPSYWDIFGGLK